MGLLYFVRWAVRLDRKSDLKESTSPAARLANLIGIFELVLFEVTLLIQVLVVLGLRTIL